ncbi:MAG TPA: hypothetical protein VFT74_21440 [Isosphaeraceae bacterium]|nr:hypothetical protein [Isosphaeraceae bacterium]
MSAWDLLKEYEVDLTFMRPDTTGIRLKSPKNQTYSRAGDYPYDEGDPSYGQPNDYDRETAELGGASHHALVPKDTSHSVWEAMGTPTFFQKSQDGSDMYGSAGTLPGAQMGWSSNPSKPWEADEDTPDVEKYGKDIAEDYINADPEMDFPSDIRDVGDSAGSFVSGLGNSQKSSRNLYAPGWKEEKEIFPESAWAAVARIFGKKA